MPALYDGIHLFAGFPHMHTLGMGIENEQVTPAGAIVDLGRNVPFNFQAQLWYPIDTILHTGDVVNTRCEWQNSTDSEVSYGSNTENEMCYSFTAYYPRVTNGLSWALPRALVERRNRPRRRDLAPRSGRRMVRGSGRRLGPRRRRRRRHRDQLSRPRRRERRPSK